MSTSPLGKAVLHLDRHWFSVKLKTRFDLG